MNDVDTIYVALTILAVAFGIVITITVVPIETEKWVNGYRIFDNTTIHIGIEIADERGKIKLQELVDGPWHITNVDGNFYHLAKDKDEFP